METKIETALLELAKLSIELTAKGGPEYDGPLFEEALYAQDNILKSYGLPIMDKYAQIIYFYELPNNIEIENRIKLLEEAATAYLLSPARHDLQVLKDAQVTHEDAFVALPELGVITHSYTIFVFEKILLKGKDTAECVLKDLRLVNDTSGVLNAIGLICQDADEILTDIDGTEKLLPQQEVIEILKALGVKYLNQCIMHESGLLTDDCY